MEKNVTPRKKNQMKQVPTLLQAIERVVELSRDSKLTQLLRFILVFLANQRFVFLICFTVFYKF